MVWKVIVENTNNTILFPIPSVTLRFISSYRHLCKNLLLNACADIPSGPEVIKKNEYFLKLKIKCNDWLLVDLK